MLATIPAHLVIDALGRAPQCELTKREQVAAAEERDDGALGLLVDVHLALVEALQKLLRRQVDDLDLVGAFEHRVRHHLEDADPSDALNDVVEALHVLHVERRVDIDSGLQEKEDVLVPAPVSHADHVGVGELVDERHRRPSRDQRVEVELLMQDACVLDCAWRDSLDPRDERLGLGAAVRLEPTRGDVDAVLAEAMRGLQHCIGLADPGREAEEDRESTPPLAQSLLGEELGKKSNRHRILLLIHSSAHGQPERDGGATPIGRGAALDHHASAVRRHELVNEVQ